MFPIRSQDHSKRNHYKKKNAVTRIRTWVITATTWGTNHYTITAWMGRVIDNIDIKWNVLSHEKHANVLQLDFKKSSSEL